MIKAIISDFSRVLLFPKDRNYQGTLNALHKELSQKPNYNPLDYFELNKELLDFYESLKDKIDLFIFTTDVIQDAPEFQPYLQPLFTRIFSAIKMNINKKDQEAYKRIAIDLKLNTDEVLYIDDSDGNIEAAKKTGLRTIKYVNNDDLFTKVNETLNT